MSRELILILGGARSGKSSYAERLAAHLSNHVLYIATAEARDDDMRQRIAAHQAERPASWHTLEAPREVGAALAALDTTDSRPEVLLLDCMTLLASNVLLVDEDQPQATLEAALHAEVEAILAAQHTLEATLILVSNEVGLGIVPAYALGRRYRDALGRINQQLAAHADRVIFMVAGLPMMVKGTLPL